MSEAIEFESFTEKYRHMKNFDNVQDPYGEIAKIKDLIDRGVKTHFLFEGPPGTGKTLVAMITARYFIKKYTDMRDIPTRFLRRHVHYYDSSDDRGMDFYRDVIKPKLQSSGINVEILDEFDNTRKETQNMLRVMMEKAHQKRVPKLVICMVNDKSKIIPALLSRFGQQGIKSFPKLPKENMLNEIEWIMEKEGVSDILLPDGVEDAQSYFDEFFTEYYRRVKGDMRQTVNGLQQFIKQNDEGETILDLTKPLETFDADTWNMVLDQCLTWKEASFAKVVSTIDELVFNKDKKRRIDSAELFRNTYQWVIDNEDDIPYILSLQYAEIISKFEARVDGYSVNVKRQIPSMISEMYLAKTFFQLSGQQQ